MAKEMLGAKVAPRTLDRLEKYADKEGISKSEAADRMIKQGLDVQESDMRLVPVQADGGTVIEDELENTQSAVGELSSDLQKFAVVVLAVLAWSEVNSFLPEWAFAPSGILLFVAVVVVGLQVVLNE
jgi:hypothetical protein